VTTAEKLLEAALELKDQTAAMTFSDPVSLVYNPLAYAWEPFRLYIERFGNSPKKIIFLGMNPGPWGMAQTGVPFGEIDAVKNWLNIDATVEKPPQEHPKRPVMGFQCQRSEVSGKRLWGLFKERFGQPERFFRHHFVANYCPLVFMEQSSRNRTPDKLKLEERRALFQACDRHLLQTIDILQPQWLVGVGKFTYQRILHVLEQANKKNDKNLTAKAASILHPSPASPAANRGWAETVTRQLTGLTIWRV
jgi:single-strand selective monofunctional uracil DNA glycosylase